MKSNSSLKLECPLTVAKNFKCVWGLQLTQSIFHALASVFNSSSSVEVYTTSVPHRISPRTHDFAHSYGSAIVSVSSLPLLDIDSRLHGKILGVALFFVNNLLFDLQGCIRICS